MKLTYWYARRRDDSNAYSIREKTKKAALAAKAEWEAQGHCEFGPVVKVTVEYADAFDLLVQALREGGCEPY